MTEEAKPKADGVEANYTPDPQQPVHASKRGMNNPDPHTGELTHEIEGDEPFSHGEIAVKTRRAQGFNRAGFRFSGDQTTVIPANSLSEERYNAIMSETQLLAIEGPSKALKENSVKAVSVIAEPGNLGRRGEFALGGSKENATPEMLAAAEQGVAIAHPSFGSTPTGTLADVDDDFLEEHEASLEERIKEAEKTSKKAEKASKKAPKDRIIAEE